MKIEEVSGKDDKNEKVETAPPSKDDLLAQALARIEKLEEDKAAKTVDPVDNNQTALLEKLVNQLSKKDDSEKFRGEGFYVNPDDIDEEDVLEDPVTFFCHKTMYVIVDDMRKGHAVKTPFNKPIIFGYQWTRKVQTGKESQLHFLSSYTSRSKKEAEWLQEHKLYGTIFFSTHKEAMTVPARKATKLARIMGVLQRYDTMRVVDMARKMGLPPSQDPHILRLGIAEKQASDEVAKEDQQNEIRIKDSIKEKYLLEDGKLEATAPTVK